MLKHMKDFLRNHGDITECRVKKLRHSMYTSLDESLPKDVKKAQFTAFLDQIVAKGKAKLSDDGKTLTLLKKRKREETEMVEEPVPAPKVYPAQPPATGNVTILLFYAYAVPQMSRDEQDAAIAFCYKVLSENGMTGRLRIAREGFNATLTGYK